MSKTFVFKDLKVVNLDKKIYVNFIDILWLLYIFMVQAKTKKKYSTPVKTHGQDCGLLVREKFKNLC